MSNFPPATALPNTDPQVIVAFHGLMTFRFKKPSPQTPGFCEVAMHGDAPKHNFTVKVFDLTSSSSDPFNTFNFGPAGSASVDKFRLDAVKADTPDVRFYQPTAADPLDFRHIVDFEDSRFYARDLEKNEALFRPKLILKTGVVVTLSRSLKKFTRKAPFNELKLGNIGEFAAAGIYLKPGGLVALRFGQQEVRLELNSGRQTLYLVLFDNSCSEAVCRFNPGSGIKEERNDFFEYYKLFAIPDDAEEFELFLDDEAKASPDSRPTPQVELPMRGTAAYLEAASLLNKVFKREIESNNEAPCGPGAFGGG